MSMVSVCTGGAPEMGLTQQPQTLFPIVVLTTAPYIQACCEQIPTESRDPNRSVVGSDKSFSESSLCISGSDTGDVELSTVLKYHRWTLSESRELFYQICV